MRAIELEMTIGHDGSMRLPGKYEQLYGQHARVVILLPEDKVIDPMKYSKTVDWPVDGLAYQRQLRDEWK